MGYIATAGFAAFHFDSKNNLDEAVAVAKREKLLLTGDINNPDVLLGGTPEDVRKDVIDALKVGITIISPECAIPIRTPNANLKTIVDTVREYCFQ
jgi:uroporphyrinogen-III decarboxylase